MHAAELSGLLFVGAFAAGLLGALTGLGGGMIIVPLLTIGFGVNIYYAIGASLISVIATSSGAAAAYVKEGYTNIRLGMFLEIATTIGALVGAFIAGMVSTNFIAIVFAGVLLYSAYLSGRPRVEHLTLDMSDRWAQQFRMNSTYPTAEGLRAYGVQQVPVGFALMLLAGVLSGLLGIGSGAVKVLAMDNAMHLPFKVSTTTSNFMIGVTAAASAGVLVLPIGAWIIGNFSFSRSVSGFDGHMLSFLKRRPRPLPWSHPAPSGRIAPARLESCDLPWVEPLVTGGGGPRRRRCRFLPSLALPRHRERCAFRYRLIHFLGRHQRRHRDVDCPGATRRNGNRYG